MLCYILLDHSHYELNDPPPNEPLGGHACVYLYLYLYYIILQYKMLCYIYYIIATTSSTICTPT